MKKIKELQECFRDEYGEHENFESNKEVISEYSEVIEKTSKLLNKYHGKNRDRKYWEIIVGDFIESYMSVILDRYRRCERASKEGEGLKGQKPNMEFLEKFSYPEELFAACKSSDYFNLYLINKISGRMEGLDQRESFQELRIDNPEPKGMEPGRGRTEGVKRTSTQTARSILSRASCLLSQSFGSEVYVCNSNLPNKDLAALTILSGGRIWPIAPGQPRLEEVEIDRDARNGLSDQASDGWLASLVLETLDVALPTCFLEGFSRVKEYAQSRFGTFKTPNVIVLGGHKNVATRIWSAESAERGATLVGMQIGGLFGEGFYVEERRARRITDNFITWGWTKEEGDIPLPALQLPDRSEADSHRPTETILWASREPASWKGPEKYGFGPATSPRISTQAYKERQDRFYEALGTQERSQLLFRPKPHGVDANDRASLEERFPEAEIDDFSVGYRVRARESKLIVVDHFGATTFLEAMAMGKPVVLYSDLKGSEDEEFDMSKIATPLYEKLHEAGIYHHTPKSAARLVNEISRNPREWWVSCGRQDIIEEFRSQFARTASDDLNQWKTQLLKLSEKRNLKNTDG